MKHAHYLWDIDIQSVPLAWNNHLQNAKKEFPDGTIVHWVTDGKPYSALMHPTLMHSRIISTFNHYKNTAREIMRHGPFTPKTFVPKILECDVALYNLLLEWLLDNSSECKNPFEYFSNKEYLNYRLYFTDDLICDELLRLGVCDDDPRLLPYLFDQNDLTPKGL